VARPAAVACGGGVGRHNEEAPHIVTGRYDAVVVGSGPNGLAAAIELARHDLQVLVIEGAGEIGGGTRTSELTIPGFRHDVCSSVHTFATASPFLATLPLDRHGLRWISPEIAVAHPLDGGRGAVVTHSLDATAEGLGEDGARYRRMMRPLLNHADAVIGASLAPIIGIPSSPIATARFGVRAVLPLTTMIRRFHTTEARALLAGMAAHTTLPLSRPFTSGMALVMALTGHGKGWPVAEGGSAALTDAMAAHLRALGGEIVTGRWVDSLDELPPARAVVLDVAPAGLIRIAGDRLAPRFVRRMRRWVYGPAVFKVDLAMSEPIPWAYGPARATATVHVGGTFEEIDEAEAAPFEGKAHPRPYLIVTQPSVVDPTRAPDGGHTAWAYAHVPEAWPGDATEAILDQIERFAPGFRDVILAIHVTPPAHLEIDNPNHVGGTIAGGSLTIGQAIGRPRFTPTPHALPGDDLYLCSSATAPGPGTHGMCGYHAATAALRRTFGIR